MQFERSFKITYQWELSLDDHTFFKLAFTDLLQHKLIRSRCGEPISYNFDFSTNHNRKNFNGLLALLLLSLWAICQNSWVLDNNPRDFKPNRKKMSGSRKFECKFRK